MPFEPDGFSPSSQRDGGRADTARALRQEAGRGPKGFRLPPSIRLGTVHLQVSSLARSVPYYETILGLRVLSRSEGEVVLGVAADGRPVVLLRENPAARPAVYRHLGLFHFAILLPDRSALGRFLDHALRHARLMGTADHAVSEAVYLADPDGLGIEVYADRPRDMWRYRGQEIRITTDPLDVPDLIAAGAGGQWSEAPSETVLGHMHLSVDDLARASAFYHEALGLDQTVWSYPGALFFSAGGYHHHVATNIWSAGAPSPSAEDARLLEWEILLPEAEHVRLTSDSLEAAGYDVHIGNGECSTADPWGTVLRLRSIA